MAAGKWIVAAALTVFSAGCVSGGDEMQPGPATENGRLHHVHLNVSDVEATTAFYGKVFGAIPVTYDAIGPALLAEQTFLFLNEVDGPIPSQLQTGVIHVGWGGVDGPSEFAWWESQGVEFYTPLSRLGNSEYFYLYGPDQEVIEIWTQQRHHRFNHIHMLSEHPLETAEWLAAVVNSATPAVEAPLGVGDINLALVDFAGVGVHILPDVQGLRPQERTGPIQDTDGSGIDHVAFSFTDLDAAYERVRALGIPIEEPIRDDPNFGVRSFFVRAPNKVLIELVEANPLPDAAWE